MSRHWMYVTVLLCLAVAMSVSHAAAREAQPHQALVVTAAAVGTTRQQSASSPIEAAIAGLEAAVTPDASDSFVVPCPDDLSQMPKGTCLTPGEVDFGTGAALVQGREIYCYDDDRVELGRCDGGRIGIYVVGEDDTGWQMYDAILSQNVGFLPRVDPSSLTNSTVTIATGNGCAPLYAAPNAGTAQVDCLARPSGVRQALVLLDDGPTYADGELWWHVAGEVTAFGAAPSGSTGWIAHEDVGPATHIVPH